MDSSQTSRIRFPALDALTAMELRKELPPGSYALDREGLDPGERGDLGITASVAVIVSSLTVQGIAAWLLKTNKRQAVTLNVEKIGPDGTIERYSLAIRLSDSEAPKEGVLRQLMSGLKLDPSILSSITGANGGAE